MHTGVALIVKLVILNIKDTVNVGRVGAKMNRPQPLYRPTV